MSSQQIMSQKSELDPYKWDKLRGVFVVVDAVLILYASLILSVAIGIHYIKPGYEKCENYFHFLC